MKELEIVQNKAVKYANDTEKFLLSAIQSAIKCGKELSKLEKILTPTGFKEWINMYMPVGYVRCRKYMELAQSNLPEYNMGLSSEIFLLRLPECDRYTFRDKALSLNLKGTQVRDKINEVLSIKATESEINSIINGIPNLRRDTSRRASKGIYLIHCGEDFKIGKTSEIEYRFGELQCGNAKELKLIMYKDITYAKLFEKLLHNIFKDKCVRGEWYKLSKKDIRWVIDILEIIIDINGDVIDYDTLHRSAIQHFHPSTPNGDEELYNHLKGKQK